MRQNGIITWKITGQSLSLRFPQGQPTSATFSVLRAWADDDGTPEFSGNATVDTVNTTLSAAAGPVQSDPQRIPLTSSVGIVLRRKYLLALNSVQEWVEPVEIGSGYIRVRYPLKNDYLAGATFMSTWLSAAIDNAWIVDRSKLSDVSDTFPDFRVKWTVVFGGQSFLVYSFFDVVREPVNHHVEIDDVNARAPGLEDSLPLEYRVEDGRPLIDAAWRAVRAHLISINIDVNALRDDEVLDELVVLRALNVVAEGGWAPNGLDKGTYQERTLKAYERFFEQHFEVVLRHQLQYAFGPLGTMVPQIHAQPIWRK